MVTNKYLSDLKIISSSHSGLSLDEKCEAISNSIELALNKHAPFREIKVGTYRKPWFNLEIKSLIKKRNKIYKQARRANSFLLFTEYKLLRSTIRNKIDTLKNSYF